MDPIEPLPPFRVRVSKRARYIQLKVSLLAQVEVIVPREADRRLAPIFVQQHRDWLRLALRRARAERAADPDLDDPRPARIDLPAVGERWHVRYVPRLGRQRYRARLVDGRGTLQVATEGDDVPDVLCTWLTARARVGLIPWLHRVSADTRLPFGAVSIRAQKTRWGSCSTQRHISLNRNLMFLAPEVVRYLMIHELCHTVHLNHSRRFWALVQRLCEDYRTLDQKLGQAARSIPAWAFGE